VYLNHLRMIRAVVPSFGALAALRTASRLWSQKHHTPPYRRARGSSLGRFGTFLLAWRVDARVTDERGGQSFGLLQDKHTCRIFAMAIIARP
jgi:hypothetical protein